MEGLSELDSTTPGGVYLCQVSDTVSCGACCGLYNVADATQETMERLLARRTELFAPVKREANAIIEFAEALGRLENPDSPYTEFHHCPFVGFIGPDKKSIGCLLHPLGEGNDGIDFRGLSYYGGFACRTYFCPTCRELEADWKRIVRAAAGDWHLYGLVITETAMLANFFEAVEKRLGEPVSADRVIGNAQALESVSRFLALKRSWPFRPEGFTRLGNYFFEENVHPIPPIDYSLLGKPRPVYAPIFEALASEFASSGELERGETIIDGMVDDFCSSL